jgi:hypothetical protein
VEILKPVMQKFRHSETQKGDCYRACICSLLEISDEDVPNFVEYPNHTEVLLDFLRERGYRPHWDVQPPDLPYYMAIGVSPRGLRHAVIYSDGKLAHDPHPDGGGVIPDRYELLEEI